MTTTRPELHGTRSTPTRRDARVRTARGPAVDVNCEHAHSSVNSSGFGGENGSATEDSGQKAGFIARCERAICESVLADQDREEMCKLSGGSVDEGRWAAAEAESLGRAHPCAPVEVTLHPAQVVRLFNEGVCRLAKDRRTAV